MQTLSAAQNRSWPLPGSKSAAAVVVDTNARVPGGRPFRPAAQGMSLQDAVRYFTRVDIKFVGCWEWRGSPSQKYPAFLVAGIGRKVHRVAYELAYGPIPPARVVLHLCDNTRCVRPEHLRAGRQRDNVIDMLIKGRHRNQNSGRLLCGRGHLDWINVPGGRKCRSCRNLRQRERRSADAQR